MNIRNFSSVLAMVVIGANGAFAQGQNDFFFSFADLGEGVVNGDAVGNFQPGDTASLFLYFSTNGPTNTNLPLGFFTDIVTSTPGVVEFTAAQTFEYDILVGDIVFDNRYGSPDNGFAGPALSVTPDLVTDLRAITVSGPGILEANNGSGPFLDAGYDAGGDAFQVGRLDFNILEPPGPGVQSVDISYLLTLVVNGPQDITDLLVGGTATINVGSPVPEPTSAGLLALGLIGMAVRRRRSSPK